MSSSTSSSEARTPGAPQHPADAAAWRRFDRIAIVCAIVFSLGVYLLLIIGDPYDSGRFISWPFGISDNWPRTANISRGRDGQFNAAVFGDSRGQLLNPDRLSTLTGKSFVQLTVPGAHPREQMMELHWFKRHHADAAAVVMVTTDIWCTSDPALPSPFPFPFWLYDDDHFTYLRKMMRAQAFDRLWRRVRVAVNMLRPTARAGFVSYDTGSEAPPDGRRLDERLNLAFGGEAQAPVPAVERLRQEIADLPPTTAVIIVVPPVFHTALPISGSREETRMEFCKARLADLAASRPHGAFIDFLHDGPMTRDPAGFLDHIHYRSNVAAPMEESIAKAVNGR